MSEPLPPSALVEALEKRAALKQYRVDELRETGGKNAVDEAAALELEAKELRAAAAFIRSTMEDSERLNLLDRHNATMNERYGSKYGWKFDWNHNRVALIHDVGWPHKTIRAAIDENRARLSRGGKP